LLDYIAQNQQYLQELGVSTEKLDKVIQITMEADVFSKLTGAGGGGCCLCLPRDPKFAERLDLYKGMVTKLETEGFQVFTDV
jgi:mevalonate kinase